MYNIILIWATTFLRLYFRRTIVYGQELVPKKVPLIVASNHPSAFMEASTLATVIGRQLHFLVRGDVFHPRFRWLFDWTNQIPIYRQKDGIGNLRKNASSFDLTYKKLADGKAVLIFPEAKTALEKKLRPVQRGTAHLAFGTLPFLKDGSALLVLPVGVNFIDPRVPGTDVVIQFGKPFEVAAGTREDRDAIEEFTTRLTEAMHPLVVQVNDIKDEPRYDVLSTVYLSFIYPSKKRQKVVPDLSHIASIVNDPASHTDLMEKVEDHIKALRAAKIKEAIYFPGLYTSSKLWLGICWLLKGIWFLAGGWMWRLVRKMIISKLKTPTFQGPTSVGAAMVLFPLVTLILFLLSWLICFPFWWVLIWLGVLALGKLIVYPLSLIGKMILLPSKDKIAGANRIRGFAETLKSNLS